MKARKIYPVILIISAFLFALAIYPHLPSRLPMHWNAAGKIDRWAGKSFWTVFDLPFVMIGVYILMLVLPKIDPFKKNYERFIDTYDIFVGSIITFLFVLNIFVRLAAMKPRIDIGLIVFIGIGLLLMVLGNFLSRIKRTFFVGIRTPWTIASDKVWIRTHRLGGRLLVGTGFMSILAASILKLELAFWVLIGATIAWTIVVTLYSYLLFQKIGRVQL